MPNASNDVATDESTEHQEQQQMSESIQSSETVFVTIPSHQENQPLVLPSQTKSKKRRILSAGDERESKRFKTQQIDAVDRVVFTSETEMDKRVNDEENDVDMEELLEANVEEMNEEEFNLEEFDNVDAHDLEHVLEEQMEEILPIDPASIEYFVELYQLPEDCKELFKSYRRISRLYPWQQEVLTKMIMPESGNRSLLYSLSTSAGKTLISEFLLLSTCQVKRRNAMLILPYVSLVEEKRTSLQVFSDFMNFHVESYFANKGSWPVPSLKIGEPTYAFIATIEKANTIINELIETNRLDELGCIVIDELHMIGDERSSASNLSVKSRGILLETCLSKINYWNTIASVQQQRQPVQIVGMSATIPNLEALAYDWLCAEMYTSDFRPVPLKEYYKIGTKIYDSEHNFVRDLAETKDNVIARDKDHVVQLCAEVIPQFSVIVFCSTKRGCEQTVIHLTSLFSRTKAQELKEYKSEEKEQLISNLRTLWSTQRGSNNYRETLIKGIPYGVVFHHSGLISEERILIETAFNARILNVICATSTLAAGVNMPARRVIFRTPYIAMDFLTVARYKQMAGRSGRAGIDEFGESYLILGADKEEQRRGRELINQPLDNCVSQFFVESNSSNSQEIENEENICTAAKLILESFCSGLCRTREDVKQLARSTLFWSLNAKDKPELQERFIKIFDTACQFLIEKNLATENPRFNQGSNDSSAPLLQSNEVEQPELLMTPFGKATYKSSFTIEEAAFVSAQLAQSRDEGIIFSDDLQICFLLTPVSAGVLIEPNWTVLLNVYNKLPLIRQRICKIIGLQDSVIFQKAYSRGAKEMNSAEEQKKELIAKRFYNALILSDIINECPIQEVCSRFGVQNAGDIQNLMTQSSMFANMMKNFCSHMAWTTFETLIEQYTNRLAHGVKADLVDLVQVEGINSALARVLYDNLECKHPLDLVKLTSTQLLARVQEFVQAHHALEENLIQLLLGTDLEERTKLIMQDARRVLNKKALAYKRLADEYEQQEDELEDYSDAEEGAVIHEEDLNEDDY